MEQSRVWRDCVIRGSGAGGEVSPHSASLHSPSKTGVNALMLGYASNIERLVSHEK
jgi:hypothetical protein